MIQESGSFPTGRLVSMATCFCLTLSRLEILAVGDLGDLRALDSGVRYKEI